jgi:glutamine synthetase
VINKLDPGEPMLNDPGDLRSDELDRRGIHRLPESLALAADNLEKDELLMDALGPMLAQSYLAVKRSEHRSFAAQETDFEIDHHFHTF